LDISFIWIQGRIARVKEANEGVPFYPGARNAKRGKVWGRGDVNLSVHFSQRYLQKTTFTFSFLATLAFDFYVSNVLPRLLLSSALFLLKSSFYTTFHGSIRTDGQTDRQTEGRVQHLTRPPKKDRIIMDHSLLLSCDSCLSQSKISRQSSTPIFDWPLFTFQRDTTPVFILPKLAPYDGASEIMSLAQTKMYANYKFCVIILSGSKRYRRTYYKRGARVKIRQDAKLCCFIARMRFTSVINLKTWFHVDRLCQTLQWAGSFYPEKCFPSPAFYCAKVGTYHAIPGRPNNRGPLCFSAYKFRNIEQSFTIFGTNHGVFILNIVP